MLSSHHVTDIKGQSATLCVKPFLSSDFSEVSACPELDKRFESHKAATSNEIAVLREADHSGQIVVYGGFGQESRPLRKARPRFSPVPFSDWFEPAAVPGSDLSTCPQGYSQVDPITNHDP